MFLFVIFSKHKTTVYHLIQNKKLQLKLKPTDGDPCPGAGDPSRISERRGYGEVPVQRDDAQRSYGSGDAQHVDAYPQGASHVTQLPRVTEEFRRTHGYYHAP